MAFNRKIKPAANIKRADGLACPLQSEYSFTGLSVEDRIAQVCKYHPLRTQQNRHLHPNLFLLGPSQNTREDGIILIHLDWPGSINGIQTEQLFNIGSTVPPQDSKT